MLSWSIKKYNSLDYREKIYCLQLGFRVASKPQP